MIQAIVAAFVLGLLVLCGLTVYATIMTPGWFSPVSFGSGFATIVGAAGAIHISHGRWGVPPTGGQ